MKNFLKNTPTATTCCLLVAWMLTGCLGGGSGTGTVAPAPTVMTAVTPPANFTWTTAQQVSTGGITLSRVSTPTLGAVKLMIANFVCVHPVVGQLQNPMATDLYASYPLNTAQSASSSAMIDLQSLQIPAAVTDVLVQVVDGNSILYSKRHTVKSLAGLSVAFPDTAPNPTQPTYMDQCP
jgi:hypothetical protein